MHAPAKIDHAWETNPQLYGWNRCREYVASLRQDGSFSHPDWSNVLEELCHFINGDGLSESCDVNSAVLRVILLLRACWIGKKRKIDKCFGRGTGQVLDVDL